MLDIVIVRAACFMLFVLSVLVERKLPLATCKACSVLGYYKRVFG